MERKEFIRTSVRWGLLSLLGLASALLAAKVTTNPDCSACPSEAGCKSKNNCPL
jgi:hypothetical protein